MPGRLPAFDPSKNACFDPHILLLGAGASLAAFPDGDVAGNRLPLMDDFVQTVGLEDVLRSAGVSWQGRNFEEVFSEYWTHPGDPIAQMRHKSRMCAEVLVPDRIDSTYILGAYVGSTQAAARLSTAAPDIDVTHDRYKFFS